MKTVAVTLTITLALASMGRERELLDSSTGRADMEPTGGEAQERLGGGD